MIHCAYDSVTFICDHDHNTWHMTSQFKHQWLWSSDYWLWPFICCLAPDSFLHWVCSLNLVQIACTCKIAVIKKNQTLQRVLTSQLSNHNQFIHRLLVHPNFLFSTDSTSSDWRPFRVCHYRCRFHTLYDGIIGTDTQQKTSMRQLRIGYSWKCRHLSTVASP